MRDAIARMRASGAAALAQRTAFLGLLAYAFALPDFRSSIDSYPAVSAPWVLAPLSALFLVGLVDVRRVRSAALPELAALAALAASLGLWGVCEPLAMGVLYAAMAYLALCMARIARRPASPTTHAADVDLGCAARTRAPAPPAGPTSPARPRPSLPTPWLAAGIVALVALHALWTLGAQVNTDVGYASVRGALQLVHGHAVYGAESSLLANLGYDPHYDTYGPVTYEAYVPFALLASSTTAARVAALFFDLLTALALLALGRRLRDARLGVLLAYAWLAFPLTLYASALATNDALVAVALTGTLLAAASPAWRGAMAALAALTKLSPLVLLPALVDRRARAATVFAAWLALVAALSLAPALAHSSLATFVQRTLGFQLSRAPGYSIWRLAERELGAGSAAFAAVQAAHGLLAALVGAGALLAARWRRRGDTVGLAAVCATLLLGLQACAGYFSFTYLVWVAPLALTALLAGGVGQETTVSPLGRAVSTS